MKITIENGTLQFQNLKDGDLFVKNEDLYIRTNTGNGNSMSLTGIRRGLHETFCNDVEVRRVKEVKLVLE